MLVPSVQPVRINTSFILVPYAGGEGPADQKKASVLLAACKDKCMDLGNGSALCQSLEIRFLWNPKCLIPRLVP